MGHKRDHGRAHVLVHLESLVCVPAPVICLCQPKRSFQFLRVMWVLCVDTIESNASPVEVPVTGQVSVLCGSLGHVLTFAAGLHMRRYYLFLDRYTGSPGTGLSSSSQAGVLGWSCKW